MSGMGSGLLVLSRGSWPPTHWSIVATSSTSRPIGPTWSSELPKATTPKRLTRPYVGSRPTTPQRAAGWRIEPPVSLPSETRHSPAETAAAEPKPKFKKGSKPKGGLSLVSSAKLLAGGESGPGGVIESVRPMPGVP